MACDPRPIRRRGDADRFQLGYGRFGEPARSFERAFEPLRGERLRWSDPVADGPVGGQVAVAFRDGPVSEVWLIDIATGEERKIAERPGLISSIELDRDASVIHLLETTMPVDSFDVVSVGLDGDPAQAIVTIEVAERPVTASTHTSTWRRVDCWSSPAGSPAN